MADTRVVLEIENGLVTQKTYSLSMAVPLAEFLPLIEHRPTIYSPVLPTNVRAEYWDSTDQSNQKLVFMMEREPQIITMTFRNREGNTTRHRLSIPWSRFTFTATTSDINARGAGWQLQDYKVFWSKDRYTDPTKEDMVPCLLPNIYEDGRICFGSTAPAAGTNFADRMDEIVNSFYISMFNRDLAIRYPNGARSWATWERLTETNPMHWREWSDWTNIGHLMSYTQVSGAAIIDRSERVIGADGIPPLNTGATWGAAEEWWNALNNNQRARLQSIVVATPAAMLVPTVEPLNAEVE